ncbi:hypothetical protein [Flagellimonas amoyensis]|uniref:hypothetical protein n=1 Tax=Flagellimonas amoyensis TaxID=2169401 RepID=UPI00131EE6A5|nr:hypothetical protein [Allomuricauda amoyensis]
MSDYWEKYESFGFMFKESGRTEISKRLEGARKHVNGMTDGWHELLTELKDIQALYSRDMSSEEKDKLIMMVAELENNLRR